MADFLSRQMDYIFFLYGTAMIILAAACFVMKRQEGDDPPWHYLGFFSLIHSAHEFMVILKPLLEKSLFLDTFNWLLVISSYLFLFEFGRNGIARLHGKAPGRWIFIPLLALILPGGWAAGIPGMVAVSKYVLGFPGGIMAAGALMILSRRHTAFPRYLLAAAGMMMALYAVATVLVAPDIISSGINFLNGEIFLRQLGLPNELLRGLLALGIAFTISLYSLYSVRLDTALHYFAERSRYIFWLSAVAVTSIIVAGWFGAQYFGNRAQSELAREGNNHAELLGERLTSLLNIVNQDVMAMAETPGIIRSLMSPRKNDDDAAAVMHYYKWTRGVDICYLLDGKGRVVDSTNRRRPDSIVGQDYSQYHYVKDSLSGVTGHYFAFDLTTHGRGYYASFPVQDASGKIVGVAVMKKNLDALGPDFTRQPGFAFLISPQGIVFLSSHSEMVLMSLWSLKKDRSDELIASRQFGPGPFTALLPLEPVDGQYIILDKKTYLVSRQAINQEGWEIVLLRPADAVILYRLLAIVITLVVCVLTISFFVVAEKSLETAAQVAVSENRFRTVFEGAPGAIFIVDKASRHILSVNPFMIAWLGYTGEELLSKTLDDIRTEEGCSDSECLYRKQDGAIFYVEEVRKEILFYRKESLLIIAHDISDRKRAEELLYSLSMSDGLTGISNRRCFDEFIEQEWRRAMREDMPVSLIMCDIDFFKNYNDAYGHQAGDNCLRQVAGVMKEMLHRPGDMAARYGGEEFAMVMAGTDLEGAVSLAESVRARLATLKIPHSDSSVSQVVTLSLGVATMIPAQGLPSSELVAAADQALYQAKSEGRNCVRYMKP